MRKMIVGLFLISGICIIGLVCGSPYSDGFRVGNVLKFSHKGWVCKTWEGETSFVGSGMMYQTWAFSVNDPKIVKQIQDAQSSGKPIKLHYDQYRFRLPTVSDTLYIPCQLDSEYVVNGVEKIENE